MKPSGASGRCVLSPVDSRVAPGLDPLTTCSDFHNIQRGFRGPTERGDGGRLPRTHSGGSAARVAGNTRCSPSPRVVVLCESPPFLFLLHPRLSSTMTLPSSTDSRLRIALASRTLVMLVLIAGAGWISPCFGQDQASDEDPSVGRGTPQIVVPEPVFDFGQAWAGQRFVHEFSISNEGDGPLQITEVRVTCGCVLAEEFDRTILPGERGTVAVKMDTTKLRGTIYKKIRVTSNDPANSTVELAYRGEVTAYIELDPVTATWRSGANFRDDPTVSVRMTGQAGVEWRPRHRPSTSESVYSVEIEEVESGRVYDAKITPRSDLPEGRYNEQLVFDTNLELMPEVQIPCRFVQPPAVQIFPSRLSLPDRLPEGVNQNVEIRFNGIGEMNILSVEPTLTTIHPEVIVRKAGRVYRLTMTFDPDFHLEPGQNEEIVVGTDLEDHPRLVIPVMSRQAPAARAPTPTRSRPTTQREWTGKPAPEGTVRTAHGTEVGYRGPGTTTVLSFVASWCPNSRRQLAELTTVSEEWKDRAVDWVVIAEDQLRSPDAVAAWYSKLGVPFPIGVDATRGFSSMFGVQHLPSTFVIDEEGVIQALHGGIGHDFANNLRTQLSAIEEERELSASGDATSERRRVSVLERRLVPASLPSGYGWITVESRQQDLGWCAPGARIPFAISIRNDGLTDFEVREVQVESGHFLAGPVEVPLPPRTTTVLMVQVQAPDEPGDFRRRVTIRSSAAQPVLEMQLWGTVRTDG